MGHKPVPAISIPEDRGKLGYLAGMLDGEGCISITTAFHKQNSRSLSYSIRVCIANANRALVDWLQDEVGGSVALKTRQDPKWKPMYHWALTGDNAQLFLEAMLPFLVIKRRQAELAIQLKVAQKQHGRRAFTPEQIVEREAIKREVRILNTRGTGEIA